MAQQMILARQNRPPAPELEDAAGALLRALRGGAEPGRLRGKRVAIAVGSRGIDRLACLVRTLAAYIRDAGGSPAVIPAMGSHGGGTADGQRDMLAGLGITEQSVGAPVHCDAGHTQLESSSAGHAVYVNPLATAFDGIVLLNRVKPHTDFSAEIESGLLKQMAIGLGNPKGCVTVHGLALRHGFARVIRDIAGAMLDQLPVLFGVAVTENWKSRLDHIEVIAPDRFYEREVKLLAAVKQAAVKLPVRELDVLLVGEIGKNISGTGMDTKVIGRVMVKGQEEPPRPKIGRIAVLGLSAQSHGNAIGIGLADFTTRAVLSQIDLAASALNCISSMAPEQGRIPCVVGDDRAALRAAGVSLGFADPEEADAILIRDTLHLETMLMSLPLFERLRDEGAVVAAGEPLELRFDQNGSLDSFWRGVL